MFKFDQQRKELQRVTFASQAAAQKRRGALRCSTGESGAQSATTSGREKTPALSATNLVSQVWRKCYRVLDLEAVPCGWSKSVVTVTKQPLSIVQNAAGEPRPVLTEKTSVWFVLVNSCYFIYHWHSLQCRRLRYLGRKLWNSLDDNRVL